MLSGRHFTFAVKASTLMPESPEYSHERILASGIVQGVGFRPFIHRLAHRLGIDGTVSNTPDGVIVEASAAPEVLDIFFRGIRDEAPPLSYIVDLSRSRLSHEDSRIKRGDGFSIIDSATSGQHTALIPPDICLCDYCRAELYDPSDRRYRYPFINCTNCGPRFTIVRDIPYDRPYTTMAGFSMCPDCRREYENPADRRYHAQPIACPVCGPNVRLVDGSGATLQGDPIEQAVTLLADGGIVAIKGIGGYHLAVDAANDDAVRRLRDRKHREEKPLAIMAASIAVAESLVRLSDRDIRLLSGTERPIVLLPRKPDTHVAPSVAPGASYLGIMLPYTPLHHLLFHRTHSDTDDARFLSLVMTSGNLSDEPICKDDDDAVTRLGAIADALLVHDRPIHVRCDDSVATVFNDEPMMLRRSRGYVPMPVFLPCELPSTLALGPELKNTLCLIDGNRAFPGQHIGDLETIASQDTFHEAVSHITGILRADPRIFAYDPHPDYLSTRYLSRIISDRDPGDFGTVGVQHHHAHISSVLAEHGEDGPVLGLALDGTGWGSDGTGWGGEVLLASPFRFIRLAHMMTVALPGGARAIKEPWRIAVGLLRDLYGDEMREIDLPVLRDIDGDQMDIIGRMYESGLNCPRVSSTGRLFDVAATIIGLRKRVSYEGQAAYELDMAAQTAITTQALPYHIATDTPGSGAYVPELGGVLAGTKLPPLTSPDDRFILDYGDTFRALIDMVRSGAPPEDTAAAFHETLMASFIDLLQRLRDMTGIATVALSGGSWQNRYMGERFPARLHEQGFRVLMNRLVPPNDGGVSLGQAYTAARIAGISDST
jgi:hydrogenase maturation protein HypF